MRTDRLSAAYDREAWSQRANEIRARILVSKVVERVVQLKKTSGKEEHQGLCPFHDERTPSFTVSDKKGFYHCFGCGAHGNAIDFVMKRQGLDFKAAVELLESQNGLRALQASRPVPPAPKARQREDVTKAERVARIWRNTHEIRPGSHVDQYLRGRGLVPPAEYGFGDPAVNAGWPVDLRYAPDLWHGLEKCGMPGMVAAMVRVGDVVAVHRTYLKATGVGVTKAGTARDKAMYGDVTGAMIRLSATADRMVGGEGIETSLSAMQLFRCAGLAFGTAGAMEKVEPPFECSSFIYAADWNAKNRTGERAAWKGARAFGVGRSVSVKIPGISLLGRDKADFNDELQAAAIVSAAPASTAGDGPTPGPTPRRRTPSLQSVTPPAVLPSVPQREDSVTALLIERETTLAEVKSAERAARLRYRRAQRARRKVKAGDAVALAAAQSELRVAGEAWQQACAVRDETMKFKRRVA